MNIYRGCTHGCIYCDSRSTCYKMDHDFEDIEVKQDALEILDRQLRSRRRACMVGTGAMGDPYIPLEQDLELTKNCLKLIDSHGFGLAVQTKSTLILRDLDILKRISSRSKCVVQTTLTTYDEQLCKILEPNAPTSYERFKMLEVMRRERIPTVVWLAPVLPFINDSEKNLRGLLEYCIQAKVSGIICFGFGVTLREGSREYFYRQLDAWQPGMKERYQDTFGSSYICMSPHNWRLMEVIRDTCRTFRIPFGTEKVFRYLQRYESRYTQHYLL